MRGLAWTPLHIPLAAGMNQRADARALPSTQLEEAIDVQFDELGGLQTRKPYSAIGSTIAGGGTLSTARRMTAHGDELLVWTKDSLYSWNDDADRWVFRATHLAITCDEKTVYATPGDQYDCDRAELSGIVFHAWTDTSKVYMAVSDKNTGAVLLAPTAVTGSTHTRPRLVAVSTRVLLFCHEGTDAAPGNITVRAFSPAETDPATWSTTLGAAGVTVLASANSGSYYDVCRILTTATCAFVARRAVTTSYEVASITDAATPVVTASTKARTADGPVAIASHPSGTFLQVIRANGTNIQGDYLTSALVDTTTGQAIGTVAGLDVFHIACAYRSTQDSSQYRCYVFWSSNEATGGGWISKYNYVDTGGTIGTEATFIPKLGIGSRAFDHDGRVFVWGVFAGESGFTGVGPASFRAQLQNTYFLYRDDATLHAKCAFQRGGGLRPSKGCLPGVASIGTVSQGSGAHSATQYAWCATERRIIPIGSGGEQSTYADRGLRDVVFTFDDNDARRAVRLGETLYVAGSEILQYDGVGLYEVGFHIYPWWFAGSEVPTGNLADGTYTFKMTWRWTNARGEIDRSTTATHGNVTIAAGPNGVQITAFPLHTTRKTTSPPIEAEIWRTAVNPTDGAPFYKVSANDPASTSNPNRYLPNEPTSGTLSTFNDEFADSTATTKETNDENGDVLESLAPPGARVIAATDTRIFLGNVAGDPDRIWYSKQRQAGKVASFHDALTFDVPREGGDITAIAFQNGICVVFREYATYMFPGDGFDNTGRGVNYGPPQIVSTDVGCRDGNSVCVTPQGIAFQSSKGKYLLTRGWTMQPIGLPVVTPRNTTLDSQTVVASQVVPKQHQLRMSTGYAIFVLDYLAEGGAWALWSVGTILDNGVPATLDACVWQGTHYVLASTGPYAEQTSYSGTSYGMDWETAWIKPNDQQGKVSVRNLQLLGESRSSSFHIRTRVAYDYDEDFVDDKYIAVSATTGDPLQKNVRMSRRKCEAFKLRATVYGAETKSTYATTADVPLSTGNWGATLRARGMGPLGDGLTVKFGVLSGTTGEVEVRDNQVFTTSTGLWTEEANTIGVKVTGNDSTATVTIATIEAAIDSYSDLIEVSSHHATPSHTLNFASIGSTTKSAGPTAGGAFAAATGESLKVTGLAMEVGVEPKVFNRFART